MGLHPSGAGNRVSAQKERNLRGLPGDFIRLSRTLRSVSSSRYHCEPPRRLGGRFILALSTRDQFDPCSPASPDPGRTKVSLPNAKRHFWGRWRGSRSPSFPRQNLVRNRRHPGPDSDPRGRLPTRRGAGGPAGLQRVVHCGSGSLPRESGLGARRDRRRLRARQGLPGQLGVREPAPSNVACCFARGEADRPRPSSVLKPSSSLASSER